MEKKFAKMLEKENAVKTGISGGIKSKTGRFDNEKNPCSAKWQPNGGNKQ